MESKMTRDTLRTRCVALAGVGDTQAAATLEALGELGRLEEQAKRTTGPENPHAVENAALRRKIEDLAYVIQKIRITMTLAESVLTGAVLTTDTNSPAAAAKEHELRIYYQTLCYDIANVMDRARSKSDRSVTGTLEEPSKDMPDWLAEYIREYGEKAREIEYLKFVFRNSGLEYTPMPAGWQPLPEQAVMTVWGTAVIPNEPPKVRPGAVNTQAFGDSWSHSSVRALAVTQIHEAREKIEAAIKDLPPENTLDEHVRERHLRKTLGLPDVQDPAVTAVNPTHPAGHWDQTPKMDNKDGNKD